MKRLQGLLMVGPILLIWVLSPRYIYCSADLSGAFEVFAQSLLLTMIYLALPVQARHNGQNYVYSLLTGYREPPAGVSVWLLTFLTVLINWYNSLSCCCQCWLRNYLIKLRFCTVSVSRIPSFISHLATKWDIWILPAFTTVSFVIMWVMDVICPKHVVRFKWAETDCLRVKLFRQVSKKGSRG